MASTEQQMDETQLANMKQYIEKKATTFRYDTQRAFDEAVNSQKGASPPTDKTVKYDPKNDAYDEDEPDRATDAFQDLSMQTKMVSHTGSINNDNETPMRTSIAGEVPGLLMKEGTFRSDGREHYLSSIEINRTV